MIITVKHDLEEDQEIEIEKFPVIIGRGRDCDIVIASDHISRKHLEIQCNDEKVFIKDLTLSNWVSYNNDKLPKGEYIQYYDFAPLVLPSGHQLSVVLPKNEKLEIEEPDVTSLGKLPIHDRKLSPQYKEENALEKKSKSNQTRQAKTKAAPKNMKTSIILAIIICLVFVSYMYYDFDSKSPTKTNIQELPSNVVNPSPTLILNMIQNSKCKNRIMKQLCDSTLPEWGGKEGVVEYKKNLFIFKDFDKRRQKISQSNLDSEQLTKIVAAHKVIIPNFLEALNKRSIKNIFIILFQDGPSGIEIIKTLVLNTDVYNQVSQQDYNMAYEQILKNGELSTFNSKLGIHIQIEEDSK